MANFTVKRSMSPDGKIDSVSVELSFEAEITDNQTILDAIASTDAYADYVHDKTPAPRTTNNVGHMTNDGGQVTLVGNVQAVFDGDISKTSGKRGPGAIIIDGTKVKSFDAKVITLAKGAKDAGQAVEVVYKVNDKWKSNDVVTIKVAEA